MNSTRNLTGKLREITLAAILLTSPIYSSSCATINSISGIGDAVSYGVGTIVQPLKLLIEKQDKKLNDYDKDIPQKIEESTSENQENKSFKRKNNYQ